MGMVMALMVYDFKRVLDMIFGEGQTVDEMLFEFYMM